MKPESINILAQLEEQGRLTPDEVVRIASDPDNPLHEAFDWDDASAAHQYRLDQARTMIRSVRFEVQVAEHTMVCPVYIHDPEADGQGYISVQRIKTHDDIAREALAREIDSIFSAAQRAAGLAAGLGLSREFAALDRAAKSVAKIAHCSDDKKDAA